MNLCRNHASLNVSENSRDYALLFPSFKSAPSFSTRKLISFAFLPLVAGIFIFVSNSVFAGTTEDVVEGAGQVSKFGIDVLEDFGLEGKSAEDTGKDRLKDFLKGKAKSFIKDTLTGGDDLSEGMGLILNKIFDGIDAKSRQRANRCKTVAYNQAWGIAFDAKNTRLLRGAANVWFDVLTSIPGVPALAEQLVMETGKAAYKKLRSQVEDKIKEWWAKQKDEAFKLTKQTDSCTINMTVLWNKKKGKYLFLISGKCDCKLLSTGRGGSVTMNSFEIIGGGTVNPGIDLSDPGNPKVKIVAGPVTRIDGSEDCNCVKKEDTRLPPPEEDPIDEWTTAPRMTARVTEAKCEACQPLLDTAIGLVNDFNKVADKMDALGKEIVAERYKTPERDANIKEWEELSKQQDAIEKKHDDIFQKFAECEEEECKLGTDPFQLPHTSDISTTSTTCKECESVVAEINELVEKHNAIAREMNILADAARRSNMKHGTVEGNRTYKKWHELSKKAADLSKQISRKQTEKTQCEATNCFDREVPYKKVKLSGACDACSGILQRVNAAEREYNAMVDKITALYEEYRQFLINGGDPLSAKGSELSHAPIKLFDETNKIAEKMYALQAELRKCDPDKCDISEDNTKIKIGNDFDSVVDELQPYGSTGQQSVVSAGGQGVESVIDELSKPLQKISTRCSPCQSIVTEYNATIDKIKDLQSQLETAVDEQSNIQKYLDNLVAFDLALQFPSEAGEETWPDGKKYMTYEAVGGGTGAAFHGPNALNAIKQMRAEQRSLIEKTQARLVNAAVKVRDIRFKRDAAYKALTGITIRLVKCERQCATVKIIDTKIITGNDPYDPRDPVAEDSSQIGSDTSIITPTTPTPVATVQVINNIPISRLSLSGADVGCPNPNGNHYHGSANNCNGVFTSDPAPGGCGQGRVSNVITIPVTSCPDL